MSDTKGFPTISTLFLSPSVPDLMALITASVFAASLWKQAELGEQKEEIIQSKDVRKQPKTCNGLMS